MKYLLSLLLLFPLLTYGQDFPKKPTNYVTSFDPFYLKNSVLNKEEEKLLNAKLRAFEDSTGIQVVVYLTLFSPASQQAYSQKIFEAWGIGEKGKEKGVLIAIFTSGPTFTMVGQGLETVLTYDICMEVLDEEMTPHFQDENFYRGIDAGVDKLIYYSKHPYEPPTLFEAIKKNILAIIGVSALLLPFIIGFLLKLKRSN